MVISDEANPLLPMAYDIAWSGVLLALAAIGVVALVSVARARGVDRERRMLWTLAVVLLPVLGAIGWFSSDTRREARARRRDARISSP